jgi:PAS domain S-box-containing protein
MEFILGATKTGLDIIDSQYNLRYVDSEWMKAYGDWTGRKCHEYFMGRSEPCPSCGIPDALRTKQISVTEEVLVKEGNRPIQVITRPYQDKNGEWLVAEANADITERKRAEEARRDSEKRYRTLFEGAVEGILVADLETRQFKHANPAVCRMLGYSEKELLRLGVADIHPKESLEQVVAEFEAQARGEKILALALQCLRKDGTVFYADVSTAPGVIDGRPCNVGFFADITERKRAEQELEESAAALAKVNAELERSNCDLEEFTHTVSHDLQEPLRKIHTFGQFLVEDLGEQLPESAREHVRRMQEAAVRMQGLIQHLLGLARVGTAGREPVAVAAGMVVDKVLETLSERVRESGADITVAAELPRVMADPVQLEQVFQNLLSNALKFRSPERQPRITIGASREGEQVRFAVSDNGIGIEERFFERIFGMFQRLHPGEHYEGAGVGLALCAKIVRRHGGRIWVESEVGKGSTFSFALPAPPSAKEGACEH